MEEGVSRHNGTVSTQAKTTQRNDQVDIVSDDQNGVIMRLRKIEKSLRITTKILSQIVKIGVVIKQIMDLMNTTS